MCKKTSVGREGVWFRSFVVLLGLAGALSLGVGFYQALMNRASKDAVEQVSSSGEIGASMSSKPQAAFKVARVRGSDGSRWWVVKVYDGAHWGFVAELPAVHLGTPLEWPTSHLVPRRPGLYETRSCAEDDCATWLIFTADAYSRVIYSEE